METTNRISIKYCCRECEYVFSLKKCENLCPNTWEIKQYLDIQINKLPCIRCNICNFKGCNNFKPFNELW